MIAPEDKAEYLLHIKTGWIAVLWAAIFTVLWFWVTLWAVNDFWLNYVGMVIFTLFGVMEVRLVLVSFMDAHSVKKRKKLDSSEKDQ